MEIENICEISTGASFIEKVENQKLVVHQANRLYDLSFGYKPNETIGLEMRDIPFRVAKQDVKDMLIKQNDMLQKRVIDVINMRSVIQDDMGNLKILESTRKAIHKKNSSKIIAIFSESFDKTSNYSPYFIYKECLSFYKSNDEATSHFLKTYGAYQYFSSIPTPAQLKTLLVRSNSHLEASLLAEKCHISITTFNNHLASLNRCLYEQYRGKSKLHLLYRAFNHVERLQEAALIS